MDEVIKLKDIPLTRPHAQLIQSAARDSNLTTLEYVQRLLQNAADQSMAMPNPTARQLAVAAAAGMKIAREIGEARRAYENVDGKSPELARSLAAAAAKASETLAMIANTQRAIA